MKAVDFGGDYYYPIIYQLFAGKLIIKGYAERETCVAKDLGVPIILPEKIMHGGVEVTWE